MTRQWCQSISSGQCCEVAAVEPGPAGEVLDIGKGAQGSFGEDPIDASI